MTKNGGYVIINLNDTNKIYKQALACLTSGKPVMVYDDPNVYYADTIALSGDDVVITKGGKTITITDANSVSSTGDIQKHLYQYYLKLNGNDLVDVMFKFYSSEDLNITMDNLIDVFENYIANNNTQDEVQLSGFDENNGIIMTSGYLDVSGDDIRVYFYGAMVNNGTLSSSDSDAIITSIDVNKLQLF